MVTISPSQRFESLSYEAQQRVINAFNTYGGYNSLPTTEERLAYQAIQGQKEEQLLSQRVQSNIYIQNVEKATGEKFTPQERLKILNNQVVYNPATGGQQQLEDFSKLLGRNISIVPKQTITIKDIPANYVETKKLQPQTTKIINNNFAVASLPDKNLYTPKGYFTAEAEKETRKNLNIGYGTALIQSLKASKDVGKIGQQGLGAYSESIFSPFNRVGIKKDISDYPLKKTYISPKGTTISKDFTPMEFETNLKRYSLGKQREILDIKSGISPELAGYPIEVIAEKKGSLISKQIIPQIESGKITFEEGKSQFQKEYEKQISPIVESRAGREKGEISSGLGKKIEFGTKLGGYVLASLTPQGRLIVGGISAGSGSSNIIKGLTSTGRPIKERGFDIGIGIVEAGIGVSLAGSASKQLEKQIYNIGAKRFAEQPFNINKGFRFEETKQGTDVLKLSKTGKGYFGNFKEEINIISPYKLVEGEKIKFAGIGGRKFTYSEFETGKEFITKQAVTIKGFAEPKGIPLTGSSTELKSFKGYIGSGEIEFKSQLKSIVKNNKVLKQFKTDNFLPKERFTLIGGGRRYKELTAFKPSSNKAILQTEFGQNIVEREFLQSYTASPKGLITTEKLYRGKRGINLIEVKPAIVSGKKSASGTLEVIKVPDSISIEYNKVSEGFGKDFGVSYSGSGRKSATGILKSIQETGTKQIYKQTFKSPTPTFKVAEVISKPILQSQKQNIITSGLKASLISGTNLIQSSKYKQLPAVTFGQREIAKTRTIAGTLPIYSTGSKSKLSQLSIQLPQEISKTKQVTIPQEIITPIGERGFTPRGSFKLGTGFAFPPIKFGFGGTKGRKRSIFRTPSRVLRKPSLVAIGLNIRSPRKGKAEFSSLTVRPILRSLFRKKKRRK